MFFGWYIVAASMLLLAYHGGAVAYGFTAFITPIAATFGWSYAQISLGLSFRGLEVGALDAFVGMAVDRWPARRLVLIGVILYGVGLFCIGRATSLMMFYTGFLILGLGNSLSIHVVPQTMLARWFKKDLGKASAIFSIGGSIGGLLVPVVVKMIDTYTWQTSLLILAAGIWVIGIPLSFVFRDRPEENILLPEGNLQHDAEGRGGSESPDIGVKVKEAIKMRAFWQIGIAYMLLMGTLHAVTTHVMPYLDSLEVERSTAGMVAMFISLVSLIARLPYGWSADIFKTKNVMAFSIVMSCAGLFFFWLIDGDSLILIGMFVVAFGIGLAGCAPVRTPLIREYFGTRNFGTIYGLMGVFNMTGQLIFPAAAGWVYDTLGSYKLMWLILGILCIAAFILMVTVPLSRNPGGSPNTR